MYGISNIGKRYIHSKFLEKHGAAKYLSISKFHTIASSCRENNLGSSKPSKRSQRKRTQKWKDDLNGVSNFEINSFLPVCAVFH